MATKYSIKFRLRNGKQVVGYRWWYPGISKVPAKWMYRQEHTTTWGTFPIPYTARDRFSGHQDKRGIDVYEHDVVYYYNSNLELPTTLKGVGRIVVNKGYFWIEDMTVKGNFYAIDRFTMETCGIMTESESKYGGKVVLCED